MKRILYFVFLLSICTCFISCNSCGDTERFISDIGYGDWDFDGDGEAGRNVNFKGSPTRKGHCYDCGLDHYGNYVCPAFIPQRSSPTTCICGCPMGRHAKN